MNLFYRKPRSFATTRRHSFSATDGCTSPSVRLSPSAVCRLRVHFVNYAFSKSDFRGRVKFRFFHLLFVRCLRSFVHKVAALPACRVFSCIFARFVAVFAESRLPDLILHLARPFARLRLASDSPANRCRPFKNDFPSDFEAFPTRIFKSLLPESEFTVYRHSFEKGNPVGRKPIFERTLCCKIIIVARLWDDASIVRIKCEKRTTCPLHSKQCLIRARHSCRLVRLSPLHSASRMIPSCFVFSLCFLCVFSVLSALPVRSYVFSLCPLSLFSVSRSDHRLKSRGAGASEFLMVFRFSVASLPRCAPPRYRIYKNPSES